jgi:hypothetical protein
MSTHLVKIFQDIVAESLRLKNKYVSGEVKVEFADIFSTDDSEFQELTSVLKTIGKIVFPTPSGDIYQLDNPIKTVAGNLYFVKIRKPDTKLTLRGDADFDTTSYDTLKQNHANTPHFELIVRKQFEMLRLSDPDFNVMACFSNIPVREWVKTSPPLQ